MRQGGRRGKQCRLVRFMEAVLLLQLHRGEAHGYSLLDRLEEFGFEDVSSSVVYRALREMEERGWVSSSWDKEDTQGPPRRVYSLTPAGEISLSRLVDDLNENQAQILHFLAQYTAEGSDGTRAESISKRRTTSMRVAISSTGDTLASESSSMFGRCPYYIVVDTDTMDFKAIPNPAVNASGGAGVKASQFVLEQKVEAVLTGRVGPNAMKVFQQAGMALFVTEGGSVEQEVQKYLAGELQQLTVPGDSHAGMGNKAASGAAAETHKSTEITVLTKRAKRLRGELAELLEEIDRLKAED
ncbi:MAG: helix-turn-helix transcriptional regulator [Anaerolineales bacterium]|nr:helix-turn-helix transcriptional regulator [Anaerolineales bacterium]